MSWIDRYFRIIWMIVTATFFLGLLIAFAYAVWRAA